MDSRSDADVDGTTDEWSASGDIDVNGDDDDTGATMGGTDMGGGMYDTPDPIPAPTDDDDDGLYRKIKRRTQRARFRSTRQARRTTGKRR